MRPTDLRFKNPDEFTPGPYPLMRSFDDRERKPGKRYNLNTSFSKAERFEQIKETPGPSCYKTIEAYNSQVWRNKRSANISKSMLGPKTGDPSYVMVGNCIKFDRTWMTSDRAKLYSRKLKELVFFDAKTLAENIGKINAWRDLKTLEEGKLRERRHSAYSKHLLNSSTASTEESVVKLQKKRRKGKRPKTANRGNKVGKKALRYLVNSNFFIESPIKAKTPCRSTLSTTIASNPRRSRRSFTSTRA